jgi:hypothetical protein
MQVKASHMKMLQNLIAEVVEPLVTGKAQKLEEVSMSGFKIKGYVMGDNQVRIDIIAPKGGKQ